MTATHCQQCGRPLPPKIFSGARDRIFCSRVCSDIVQAKRQRDRRKATRDAGGEDPVDRKHFAGSTAEIANLAKEIERDPELRAARARLRFLPTERMTFEQRLEEMRAARRRIA
jgi:predicted nucleic acid-binding Zn ribbon protein